jgi:hypothetical protein
MKHAVIFIKKVKGKVYPRTGYEGPEGEQTYSSTLSLTSAIERGGWSMPCSGCFTPGKETWYPLYVVTFVCI